MVCLPCCSQIDRTKTPWVIVALHAPWYHTYAGECYWPESAIATELHVLAFMKVALECMQRLRGQGHQLRLHLDLIHKGHRCIPGNLLSRLCSVTLQNTSNVTLSSQ
jgi:hypothetical protein